MVITLLREQRNSWPRDERKIFSALNNLFCFFRIVSVVCRMLNVNPSLIAWCVAYLTEPGSVEAELDSF